MSADLDLAIGAARAAGEILRGEFARGSAVRSETGKDIKLEADVVAEREILGRLRAGAPYPVLSEEAGADAGFVRAGHHWVIDPLDGTFNFSRRLPWCCVSIGLWRDNEPVLRVIHEFLTDRMFVGVVDAGVASVDGHSISVSTVATRDRAVIATGFPSGRDFNDVPITEFVRQAQSYKKMRLIGSAALSLAYVATGAIDLYHEEDIYLWDVAAGLALVKAAGGSYSMLPGTGPWQFNVVASNGRLLRTES